jgi:hypothetical protein
MDQAKRSKALKLIVSLQRVVDHPNTGDGERQAAQGRIDALKEKWDIKDEPKKAPPHNPYGPPKSNHDYWNFTRRDPWNWVWDTENSGMTEEEKTAHRIKRQQEEYERWKQMNYENLRARKAQQDMDEEAQEAARKREEEAEEKRKATRKARVEAQERWKRKMASKNADGMPLTEEEMEEARRDPLGWAAKQDGRTAAEKNADAQSQYTHTYKTRRCERPETFYDPGGIPRKRNDYPMDCFKCGHTLLKGEGALFKLGSKWESVCCEAVPGPRKKKPGRG